MLFIAYDFVVEKQGFIEYFQANANMSAPETFERKNEYVLDWLTEVPPTR